MVQLKAIWGLPVSVQTPNQAALTLTISPPKGGKYVRLTFLSVEEKTIKSYTKNTTVSTNQVSFSSFSRKAYTKTGGLARPPVGSFYHRCYHLPSAKKPIKEATTFALGFGFSLDFSRRRAAHSRPRRRYWPSGHRRCRSRWLRGWCG